MRRRDFIKLIGGATALPIAAHAQQHKQMRRIGALMNLAANDPEAKLRIKQLRQALGHFGWSEGLNIQTDYRWAADTNGMILNAAAIVATSPDLILASGTPAVTATRAQTRSIPIVFVLVSDPVGRGFVDSLNHPGGNATGFTNFEFSMAGKWLEILRDITPQMKRVGLLFNPDTAPYAEYYFRSLEAAAHSISVRAVSVAVRNSTDIESALTELGRDHNGALVVAPDLFTVTNRKFIMELTGRYRLPTIYPYRYMAAEGGLLSYGVNSLDLYERSAAYVDRILKGERPADLPVQGPTKYELTINLKTAMALGLTVPPALLATADEVIE